MKNLTSEKTSLIAGIIIIFMSYFFITSESVLTVHDDILTYAEVQHGDLISTIKSYAENGRISHIPMTFLLWIPYYFHSVTAVRIFSAVSVLFNMSGLYVFIKNNAGKYNAYLTCLLFISFACISNQHNLFVAYTFAHQLPVGIILFSLDLYIKYLKHDKFRHKITSSVLFFTACFMYEAMTVFFLMFAGLSLYRNRSEKFGRRMKILIRDVFFHGIFLFVYLVIYVLWRYFHPSYYDGTRFYLKNVPMSILALFKFSLGMTPMLPTFAMLAKKYITWQEFIDSVSLWNILAPVIAGTAFYKVFPKIRKPEKITPSVIFCISGMIVPNVLISLTEKYTYWAGQNAYSYVPSFYSYFFMIMLLVAVFSTFKRGNVEKSVEKMLSICVALVTLVCSLGNTAWDAYFSKNLDRYRAFEEAVSSEYFDDIPDGTVIYIPDYTGIHNDMNFTAYYADVYISADVTFENNYDDIDFSKPVVSMLYDEDTKKITVERIN
ncbi:MAG: hypothetical protein K2I06_03520 [Ruminococcus sp.]|nr:hypothetical protein [Ruminococcus sp.]